jgi:C-terminal processing protease CtpA/Prc
MGGLFVGCSLFESYSEDERERYYNYQLLKAYSIHADRLQGYEAYENENLDSLYNAVHDTLHGANYTRYAPPPKADSTKDEGESSPRNLNFGFEYVWNSSKDTAIVLRVYPISPAASAGLLAEDRLLFAGDRALTGVGNFYMDSLPLRVSFTVLRGGAQLVLAEAEKTEVRKPTVFLTDWECPFIQVTEFATVANHPQGTAAEFEAVLAQIQGAGVAVLDLRGNRGGNIMQCDRMAADLLGARRPMIIDTAHFYDSGKKRRVVAPKFSMSGAVDGLGAHTRWLVLVNRSTASCSERMVAALKFNRPETVILGDTTYGKGIGQTSSYTYAGGYATITSLMSYRPDGTTWHRKGIVPDVVVDPNSNDIYRKVLQ